ncbi:replication protein A 70 kDa DNA-binding subunit C-like [Senna tora]|uniref:Replication protein A 70 kDa DNA-binding subunit C-like n=1 Tax=Senna tora TaxID=362788 RepID=A0A834XBR4_9FABA|nr:replication protein A 70 kDa DNA-binding subunit C-like [Senna tora]
MYASRMLNNFDIEEIVQLCDELLSDELASPVNLNIHNSSIASSPLEAVFAGWSLSSINDLNFAGDVDVLCILATVLKVNSERGWFYGSCKRCAKKLEPKSAMFYCNKSKCLVNASTPSIANVTVFDRDVSQFLDMIVMDLHKENFQVHFPLMASTNLTHPSNVNPSTDSMEAEQDVNLGGDENLSNAEDEKPTTKKKKLTSKVWLQMTKLEDGSAQCNHCKKIFVAE